jgi:hypothetical protein
MTLAPIRTKRRLSLSGHFSRTTRKSQVDFLRPPTREVVTLRGAQDCLDEASRSSGLAGRPPPNVMTIPHYRPRPPHAPSNPNHGLSGRSGPIPCHGRRPCHCGIRPSLRGRTRALLAEVSPATPIVMHHLGRGYERSTVGAVAGPKGDQACQTSSRAARRRRKATPRRDLARSGPTGPEDTQGNDAEAVHNGGHVELRRAGSGRAEPRRRKSTVNAS